MDVDPKIERQKDKDDTYRRFKHLLGLTDLFRHFISLRAKQDKNMQKLLKSIDAEANVKVYASKRNNRGTRHYRKTEKEEDAELMEDEEEGVDSRATILTESPTYVKEGKLRDYQIQGLNWLISLHENKLAFWYIG